MFGSQALEIAMSLSLLYLLLALICSVANEWVAGMLNMRAKNLWEGMRNLLYDDKGDGLAKQLYDHALIKNLGKAGKLPSYVPSRTFAMALFDLVAPVEGATTTRTLQDIRDRVSDVPNESVKKVLLTLIDDAGGDLKKARENVERWYDDAMDRVAGWYKKKAQALIFVWALVVTVSVNADTILIATTLANDATMRAALVAMAEATAKEPLSQDPKGTTERAQQMSAEIQKLGLPIGWVQSPDGAKATRGPQPIPSDVGGWALKVVGLLLTTGAVSLGAPFWFDVLNKLVNIRSAGKQPERSQQQKELSQAK
jgi:hypothetical protein